MKGVFHFVGTAVFSKNDLEKILSEIPLEPVVERKRDAPEPLPGDLRFEVYRSADVFNSDYTILPLIQPWLQVKGYLTEKPVSFAFYEAVVYVNQEGRRFKFLCSESQLTQESR
ncbi:MAG: hypothetical protein V1743_07505 [Nanoarchaeota archaeon]